MRDPLVYAVHGDRALYQVVCSDAEKIDLSCQGVSDQDSTWYLDHDADLDVLLERFAFFTQLGLATLKDLFGLAEFGEARDHWKHHPNVAKRADPQNRAKLRLENIGPVQTKPDRAAPKERVDFRRQMRVTQKFVPADIQRPDNNRFRLHCFRNRPIGFVLLFLSRQIVLVEKEKLGPVQADPFRAGFDHQRNIFRELDVRRQNDMTAV